jgi:hypothetical protein
VGWEEEVFLVDEETVVQWDEPSLQVNEGLE